MSISQGNYSGEEKYAGKSTFGKRLRRWWNSPHPLWARLHRAVASAHPSVTEIGEKRRAELLAWIALILALFYIIAAVVMALTSNMANRNALAMIALSVVTLVTYALSRTRYYRWGGWLITGSLIIIGYAFVILGLGDGSSLSSFVPLAFVLGSILLSPWALLFWVLVGTYAMIFLPASLGINLGSLVGIFQTMGGLLLVAMIFRDSIERQRLADVRKINMDLLKANTSVEEASRRTRTVFQTLAEGVGVTDPAGNLVQVNDSLRRLAGYARTAELLGKNAALLVAEVERDRLAGNFSFGTDLGKAVEYPMLAQDGSPFVGEITVSVLQDEQGQRSGFVLAVRDITLQKQAAETIRTSEARQRQILDTIPASILITRLPGGEIIYANQTMLDMYGIKPDELANISTLDLFSDPAVRDRLVATLQDQGKLENFVGQTKRLDNGQTFWGDLSGRFIEFAGERVLLTSIMDVSARRQAEESLLARDEVLQKHSQVISELSRSANVASGDLQAALKEITETASQTLGAARASVWFYNDQHDQIVCEDMFEQGKGHARGAVLSSRDYPGYFAALQSATAIAADDAHAHPARREFSAGYLIPLGINSMLDAPVRLRGRTVGVLSCEHIGPKRHWTLEEENFATSIVDFVTATLEAQDRVNLTRQIEASYERRGVQVQLSTQIAQEISTITQLDDLFSRVVTLVKERFGYYHSQLLRYDPSQNAVVLIKGYGEMGAQMLAARHRMPMGTGLIGTAAATGTTVMRADLTNDPDWQPNPLLPETKGEIAVPIKLRGQVQGVLDVQSDQVGALTQDDQILLEGLCGQVAVAIEETRLRQEMKERLEELNALYASMSREGWDSMQDTLQTQGYMYDQVSVVPLVDDQAGEQGGNRMQTRRLQSETFAVAPLSLHGNEQIGTVAVEDDPARPLSEGDRIFMEQVAEQVALALESARLFAQTQNTLAETQALYTFSEAISHGGELSDIYNTMARLATEGTGLTGSWVATYDKAAQGLMGVAGVNLPPERIYAFNSTLLKMPSSFAALTGKTVIVNDPRHDERMAELPEDVKTVLGKSIAVPIIFGDEVHGILAATTTLDGPDIGDREERLLEHIVTQASVSIQRAQLFTQIRDALTNSQESEQLVRTIIDSTPDWIYVRDQDHRFRMVNVAYADSLHMQPDDIIGKTDLDLGFQEELVKGNPEKGLTGYWGDDDAVIQSEQPRNIPNEQVILDGEAHIFNTYKAPLRDADGKVWGVLGVSRDVTERERVQAAISQRARELSTVAELGTQISAVLDPTQMLISVVDLVKDSFALYHAHIYLLDEPGGTLSLTAGAGEVGRQMVAQGWQIPLDREKSLVARAARSRQGVIVNNVRADVDFMPNELLPDTQAELAVPLMVGEHVLGVLDIQSNQVNHFTDEDVSIQTVLASQVAVALQNARTYAQTQRQAEYEMLINTISQKIQSTTSVENALQVAVRELGRALGASRTSVQLSLGKKGIKS